MPALHSPALQSLFSGRAFADVLEGAIVDALEEVHRLEVADFATDLDHVEDLTTRYDVALPIPEWEPPHVRFGTTDRQTMRAVVSWSVSGYASALRWRPRESWIGTIRARVGLEAGRITTVIEGHRYEDAATNADLLQSETAAAMREVRRFVDAHRAFLVAERAEWHPNFVRRVRDAVAARRALVEGLPTEIGAD